MLREVAEDRLRLEQLLQQRESESPETAPCKLPRPPRMIIISTVPDTCQPSISGFTKPSFTANRNPASPATIPEITNAASL